MEMENVNFIISQYLIPINAQQMRKECIEQTFEIKMSSGNKAHVPYGLYPPDKKVYILYASKKIGHITKIEQDAEYKYYFNKDGKIILIEHYEPHKGNLNESFLLSCIFYEYQDDKIHIICTHRNTNKITFVANCEFNKDGELVRYLCGEYIKFTKKISFETVSYKELILKYNKKDINITYNIFYKDLLKDAQPSKKTESYVYRNDLLFGEGV